MTSLRSCLLGALAVLALAACEEPPFESGNGRVLLLNGKLSSQAANYTLNEQAGDGHWLGNELLVYDPSVKGEVRHLGRLDYGPSRTDPATGGQLFDFQNLQVREVAASAGHGVWVLAIDTGTQDEWYVGHVTVPDWAAQDQRLPVEFYALQPTDTAAYELQEVSALGFAGDALLMGSDAEGAFGGALVGLTSTWPPAYASADERYYVEGNLSQRLQELPDALGFPGDVEVAGGRVWGVGVKGSARGTALLMDLGADGRSARVVGQGTVVPATDLIEGLAAVQDTLFGVSLEGKVYRFDTRSGEAREYDDLSAALPPDELGQSTRRLRGAAGVVLP